MRSRAAVVVREHGRSRCAEDILAAEVPVALVYNGTSHAVMMASPADLDDFALGFSLSEGILESPAELYACERQDTADGISLELEISSERYARLRRHRRNLAGRTGCGLCGREALAGVLGTPPRVIAPQVSAAAIERALHSLGSRQALQQATGAVHAAAWCDPTGEILQSREDVGRHNALDKLVGALFAAVRSVPPGFALVSSRASYEMVEKSCAVGIGALVAVSAPTALAVERARAAGQRLIGFARPGRHVVYHDPDSCETAVTRQAGGQLRNGR